MSGPPRRLDISVMRAADDGDGARWLPAWLNPSWELREWFDDGEMQLADGEACMPPACGDVAG